MPQYLITVNGREHHVESQPDCPLLYVLRNRIGLTSPRFGCGEGDCGACAVLVDGSEARSCSMTMEEVHGEITTVEGLTGLSNAADGELHPVQQAWIDEQVPQCGYCQSGMMIAAVNLLGRVPNPSVPEIKQAFSSPDPHLCRCGTYAAIIRAVQVAAKAMQ
jgi:aerobic-type carbon monoxide dehydrogenase small subunit (CoxS/CutS family)